MKRRRTIRRDVFLAANVVLAAGGPGEMYQTSVYPRGQVGLHGLALRAGLAAENLTESQFGQWRNSAGMSPAPTCEPFTDFGADAAGKHERDFLADFFPSMKTMATDIFLKGYQWPFDPQKIENLKSSLIDILVFNENQKGRRVFLDFRQNPLGSRSMQPFNMDEMEPEASSISATPARRRGLRSSDWLT
jgi:succinate dehydrogenase/fumarate reductase flavoprotein subunit